MVQPSLFSEQARAPRPADLAGVLCAQGQALGFGRGVAARLSVVVDEPWRADELARSCAVRDLAAERGSTDEGHPVLRTAFLAELAPLAAAWTRGAVKAVPAGLQLDGAMLRLWAVTAGGGDGRGYVLGLDPHAHGTHEPLAAALASAGLAATLIGPRGGGPALRITGRRRVARLAELVGEVPVAAAPASWPA
ncbi:MAG: hypothetical protein GEV09_09485 [Pseudonocardiaceae bacterium]|nr:hypothetical protein [Pseudonocardiaceae bacterium]